MDDGARVGKKCRCVRVGNATRCSMLGSNCRVIRVNNTMGRAAVGGKILRICNTTGSPAVGNKHLVIRGSKVTIFTIVRGKKLLRIGTANSFGVFIASANTEPTTKSGLALMAANTIVQRLH